jgi:chemotaxis response regulator CheB
LLTVALHECEPSLDVAAFAALPGFEWVGDVADYNEGLRQVLMKRPDVVATPLNSAASKLLQVLAYLRRQGVAPVVMAVASEASRRELPPSAEVFAIDPTWIDPSLVPRLRQWLAERE